MVSANRWFPARGNGWIDAEATIDIIGSLIRQNVCGRDLPVVGLFVFQALLAKMERAESRVEAARFYSSGQSLMRQGQSAEAVDQFRSAISVERDNQDYQLALGQALLAAGRPDDAESILNGLLQRNPFGAMANLAMARVLVTEGDRDDAASYYHRAIYGQWPENARRNQVQVRFELIDLLSRQNSREALLAELLPLQAEAPDDVPTRKKLGNLFITAGSPARAADIFREILQKQPLDPEAHAGLGDAELARANYQTAQTEFQEALRLGPSDQHAQERLDLCNRVLDLDPMRRGMGPEEQYRRGRKLVELVLDDVRQWRADVSGPARRSSRFQDAAEEPVLAGRLSAALEDNVDWAERLWQVRKTGCKQNISASEQPLASVLAMLAQ